MDEDNNEDDIFTKEIADTTREPSMEISSSKKGLILIYISIGLILVAVAVILYFIFETHMDEQNYITAKYMIKDIKTTYNIFNKEFLNQVKKIKLNDDEITKNNNISFNKEGTNEIIIIFNENLKILDNLFFQIESLEEVDLSHLTVDARIWKILFLVMI